MASTAGMTLLDEVYAARRHLATEQIDPLERAGGRTVQLDGAQLDGAQLDGAQLDGAQLDGAQLDGAQLDGAQLDGGRHWAQYELGKLRFKLQLLDHLIDLFRLHDSTAVAGAIEQEALRARRELGSLITDAQVAAICRMRARTMAIERQVACVYATLLMIESDVMAEPELEVFPVEFEMLDGKFGSWFGTWERNVGPVMAAFCRTHGTEDDRRLRVALADYVAQVSAATWPRLGPAARRPAVPPRPQSDTVVRFAGSSPAAA